MKAEVPKDKFDNLTNSLYVLNGKLYDLKNDKSIVIKSADESGTKKTI